MKDRTEKGMVTAEWAISAPPVILGILLLLTSIVSSFNAAAVANAAREIARDVAITGSLERSNDIAHEIAGTDAHAEVSVHDGVVAVVVTKEGSGIYDLLDVEFEARHSTPLEPR